ncbi:hypothetical protein JTE90_023975 [Oedothorax gibbosus]|uniref:Uncharacterized protein n=1 Tax=Oedothorax gibbosus TaxID=931172 RepID=A0AAV6UI45_9ARAC|nr:hypothetical protein JTE90_023975 [Oedothorax gibbosus]
MTENLTCYCAKNRESPKCKFSIDIVSFIMKRFYMGYEWEPPQEFAEPILDSPLTPAIKNAAKQIFLNGRIEMHEAFEDALCDDIQNAFFGDACDFVIEYSEVRNKPFDPKKFLQLCVILCSYGARSFNRGAEAAPIIAMSMICQTVQKLTMNGFFSEDSWLELDHFCENNYPKPAV